MCGLKKICVGYLIGALDDAAVQRLLVETVEASAGDPPEIGALIRINLKKKSATGDVVGPGLVNVTKILFPNFDPRGVEAEGYAKAFWSAMLHEYDETDIAPWEICRMVPLIEEMFDFPTWLGDMFGACDWVDEKAVRTETYDPLRNEVRRQLGVPGYE